MDYLHSNDGLVASQKQSGKAKHSIFLKPGSSYEIPCYFITYAYQRACFR